MLTLFNDDCEKVFEIEIGIEYYNILHYCGKKFPQIIFSPNSLSNNIAYDMIVPLSGIITALRRYEILNAKYNYPMNQYNSYKAGELIKLLEKYLKACRENQNCILSENPVDISDL